MVIANPCIRCGKQRICVETREDSSGAASTITYTTWICPDPECQKVVAAAIKVKKEKADTLRREIEERALARKAKFPAKQ